LSNEGLGERKEIPDGPREGEKVKVLTEGIHKKAGVSPRPSTPKQEIRPPPQKPQKPPDTRKEKKENEGPVFTGDISKLLSDNARRDIYLGCLEESKKSMIALLKVCGNDTRANIIMLKWIDLIESLLKEDYNTFEKELKQMVTMPILIMAEAIFERCPTPKDVFENEIKVINLNAAKVGPLKTKKELIRVCNTMLGVLKTQGIRVEYIDD